MFSLQHFASKNLFNDSPKIGVLASGRGSNFEAIIKATEKGEIDCEIVGLITNIEDAGAIEIAKRHSITSKIIKHQDYKSRREFDAAVSKVLLDWGTELVVMAGWMRIATPALIEPFLDRIVNIHPSLLPSFKGLHAFEQSLFAGVTIAGCTVHVVNNELDSGAIIGQAAFPVSSAETLEILKEVLHHTEHQLYPLAIQHYIQSHKKE